MIAASAVCLLLVGAPLAGLPTTGPRGAPARAAALLAPRGAPIAHAYVAPTSPGMTPAPDTHTRAAGPTLALPRLLPPSLPRHAFDRPEQTRARARVKGQMIAPLFRVSF